MARWLFHTTPTPPSNRPIAPVLASALALVATLLILPPDTAARSPADSVRSTRAASPLPLHAHLDGVGVWIGGSPFATALIAKTKDAQFGLIGLQYARVLATENHIAVRYTADLIPAALLHFPPAPQAPAGGVPSRPVYGAGVAPVGLQFVYRTHRAVQPFFGGSGGLMAFPHRIPDRRGRRVNYTFDVGVGVRWVLGPRRVLTVGYRFHHLSNGFRGDINPGFDANIFYIGLATM